MSNSLKPPSVSAAELHARIEAGAEIAVLDVRETGVHARDGHILLSVSLPLSQLELIVRSLVPRISTPVVVYDGGDDALAKRAAHRLTELGYADVAFLKGGTEAWVAAGYQIFRGVSVIGKAFGEHVEHINGTPHLSAHDLKERLDAGQNVVVVDSRTVPEFSNFSIPGAIDLPGAEIVYRFHEAVPDPDTLVVVNCAGRTRSIIGAQALINAGVPNKVVALEGGTMSWLMEGLQLDKGKKNLPSRPKGKALANAEGSARRLFDRFKIDLIGRDRLKRFQDDADSGSRSLYLLDVRQQDEYESGHVPGSRWAQGGQLVQHIGQWIGTRNARIVLIDDEHGVRAAITSSWLTQLNWGEVYVLKDALKDVALETGPERRRVAAPVPKFETIEPEQLKVILDRGDLVVLDLDTTVAYEAGHIPGAHSVIRSRLVDNVESLPGSGRIVLTSSDGVLAAFAAGELATRTKRPIALLAGGTAAWKGAGLPLEQGETSELHGDDDVVRNAYQAKIPESKRFDAFREYLGWEQSLVRQLELDGTARFRSFA